jgi:hypothetical protein
VRVRLTDAEYARWDAARAESGRREMGAWVRAVVEELLTGRRARRRPGDLPRRIVPAVNIDAYRQLVGVASNVNQLAHWCNSEERAPEAEQLRRLASQLEALAWAVRGSGRSPAPEGMTGQPPHTPHTLPRQAPTPAVEQQPPVDRVDQDRVDQDDAGGAGRRRWFRRDGNRP